MERIPSGTTRRRRDGTWRMIAFQSERRRVIEERARISRALRVGREAGRRWPIAKNRGPKSA